jgi:hypothetical protein
MDYFRVADQLNSGLDAVLFQTTGIDAGLRAGQHAAAQRPRPVCDPIPFAAIGKDKRGEIAQERLMPPALTCV